jgi:hypothetical protein
MRGSFWTGWRSRRWMRSWVWRRRSPSGRRIRRGIRGRRWRHRRRSTTSCACCTRGRGRRIAPPAATWCGGTRWTLWPRRWRPRRPVPAGTRCSRCMRTQRTPRCCGIICSNCGGRGSTGCTRAAGCLSSPHRNRCSISTSPSRCSCWPTGFPSRHPPSCAPASPIRSRPVTGRRGRCCLNRRECRSRRSARSTRSSPARSATWSTRRRSRSCSVSTTRWGRARGARASGTSSITTWIW